MFRIGDLVTGIDRSYSRSIYRFEVDYGDEGLYRIISLNGRIYDSSDPRGVMKRKHAEFRLATNMEIKISSDYKHTRYAVIIFLRRLGIGTADDVFAGFV